MRQKVIITPWPLHFVKSLFDITLTATNKALLPKGLKDIPTSPIPASNTGLLTDFNNFARNMRFKCRFAN